MKLFIFTLFFVISQFDLLKCEKEPFECLPQVARILGVSFCMFTEQSTLKQDATKIRVFPAMFQGQYIQSSRISMVIFSACDIEHVPSVIYKTFASITWLIINHSTLDSFDHDDFKLAANLKRIEVKGTKIGRISSKAFSLAKNLEELTIENCEIGIFAEDAFEDLENLKTVNLKGNTFNQGTPNFSNEAINVIFS